MEKKIETNAIKTFSPPSETPKKGCTSRIRVTDIVVPIFLLLIAVGAGLAISKLTGRISIAAGVGVGAPILLGSVYIALRVCAKAPPHKGFDLSDNLYIGDKLNALPLPPKVDQMVSIKVLNKTKFSSQESLRDFHVKIDANEIRKQGLEPKYNLCIRERLIYLSDVFEVENFSPQMSDRPRKFLSAIGYVWDEKENCFHPRLFYRSGTHGLWKVSPWIQGNGSYGKGIIKEDKSAVEESVTLPIVELGLPLDALAQSKIVQLKGTSSCDTSFSRCFQQSIPEFSKYGKNNEALETNFAKEVTVVNFFISPNKRYETRNPQISVPDLSSMDIGASGMIKPNFNKATIYPLKGSQFRDGHCFVFLSFNKQYRYTFYLAQAEYFDSKKQEVVYVEKRAHPCLIAVEYVGDNQKLTSFGTFSKVLNTQGATVPLIEASQQTPTFLFSAKDKNLVDEHGKAYSFPKEILNFYPTWAYRQHLPVLKEFQGWLDRIPENPCEK